MADDTEKAPLAKKGNAKAEKSGKRGKGKIVLVLMLLLGAAAGYTLKGGGSGAEAAGGPTTTAPPEPGVMVGIEPLSLNLADGHYLKVGIAVQLNDGAIEGAGGHGVGTDVTEGWLAEHGPMVRDLVISELGGAHIAEFASAEAREIVRHTLLEKANERLHETVYAIYFTEFIMQ
jgi:flagellar FliL protein